MTGALFNIFVGVYLLNLVERHLPLREVVQQAINLQQGLTAEFTTAYKPHKTNFKSARLDARNYLGH